ncbi:MAG TPA: hypothetical protein VG897_01600, partial [Terriglobales bacterium]|nr:hypothetical protein [Terriglobales bacterium]
MTRKVDGFLAVCRRIPAEAAQIRSLILAHIGENGRLYDAKIQPVHSVIFEPGNRPVTATLPGATKAGQCHHNT